jgi:hypothetical protein
MMLNVYVHKLTFCTDRHQFHSFRDDELERFQNVANFVHPHFSSLRFGQSFSGYNLE